MPKKSNRLVLFPSVNIQYLLNLMQIVLLPDKQSIIYNKIKCVLWRTTIQCQFKVCTNRVSHHTDIN